MASSDELPLYDKIYHKNTIKKALDITILFLLLCLLHYRLSSLKNHGFAWFLAFLCESCFTFSWVLIVNLRWTPLSYTTYPQRLRERVPVPELPRVDMLVTTADAELEPPIITVNTVLSLLAVEYPAHKLACYVSDDGCSPLTFYSLVEASKFAKLWVPFCRKYNVQVRAPFRYFSVESAEPPSTSSWEFQQDWRMIKEEYEKLSGNIQRAASASFDLSGEFAVFSVTERNNHPSIIKVIWENSGDLSDGIPHLIYISREKRPNHPHHYKAGAMNVLTRVSGLMTNAPFMLNVDCDMYVNNPEIFLHSMCLHLGSKEKDCGFVQFPQRFYDCPADLLTILEQTLGKGVVGIQGPYYQGTGAFHRRKVIYGLWADELEYGTENVEEDELAKRFGNSKELIKSAAHALDGKSQCSSSNLSNSLEAADQVAGCSYEYGSSWGRKVGWSYGSTTEDILTGLTIHAKGWRSCFSAPDPDAFLGSSPPGGPAGMRQQKRWASGILEVLFHENNPISATLKGKLQFRQCLAYLWTIFTWSLRPIPELCYVALPAYCIITNSSFLPKVQEPGICIPVAILVIYKLYTLSEYIHAGFPISSWWANNCMTRIISTSAWLFGLVNVILKFLGLSETVFEVTKKVHKTSSTSNDGGEDDDSKMMFDESAFFVPGTTVILVHLAALATGLFGLQPQGGGQASGLGEYLCSVYVVLCFWPFVMGLFEKGKYGIPLSTICKSAGLALLFLQFRRMISKN